MVWKPVRKGHFLWSPLGPEPWRIYSVRAFVYWISVCDNKIKCCEWLMKPSSIKSTIFQLGRIQRIDSESHCPSHCIAKHVGCFVFSLDSHWMFFSFLKWRWLAVHFDGLLTLQPFRFLWPHITGPSLSQAQVSS